jgi:hypothetical protein
MGNRPDEDDEDDGLEGFVWMVVFAGVGVGGAAVVALLAAATWVSG